MEKESPYPINMRPVMPETQVGLDMSVPTGPSSSETYVDRFNRLLASGGPYPETFPVIPSAEVPTSGRYPQYFPGMDNEQLYALNQSGWEKAKNGLINFGGTTLATFLEGTIGTAYGTLLSASDGKFSSMYQNPVTQGLNDWSTSLTDKYALYKTERERNGHWWEPANLFTGNFFWDNIIRNLGFSVGTIASGFVWGGALKALGVTAKLTGMGAKMAATADDVIANASKLPQIERLGAINSGLSKTLGQGLLNADRAIVATMGTVGEAGLEALNNAQQFRQTMIDQFIQTHGYSPGKEDLEEIDRYAASVGNWSYWANVGLLTLTNYVQLPRIMGSSFKGDKEYLNNIIFKEGKYIQSLPEKGFGKFLYKTKNIAGLFFNKIEGFEEGAQYTIQTGTQNYFRKKQEGMNPSLLDDGVLAGVRETLTTDEGLLNVAIGGLAGALQTSGIPTLGRTGLIKERGITGYGGESGRYRSEAIGALNQSMIRNKLKDFYSNTKASEIDQKDREIAINRGDMLESKDLEFDYAHRFISSRLKYNAKEAIKDEIDSLRMQASTTDGFRKLKQEGIASPSDTTESFMNRLNNIQEHANNASELYDTAKIKYKGQVDKETNKPLYTDDVIDKMVYAGAKVMDYDRRIPGISARLASAGVDTIRIIDTIITGGEAHEQAVKDGIAKIDALGIIDTKKKDLYQDLADLVELSMRKNSFIEEYNDIVKNPKKHKEEQAPPPSPKDEEEKKKTVKIRTEAGEKEYTIGEEYYLGRVVEHTAQGAEVYRAPRLTILGQNADGTIQVRDSGGTVHNISPDKFKDYRLGRVALVKDNPVAKFFFKNWNNIVYQKLKGGKQRPGRLEHDPDTNQLYFTYRVGKKGKGFTTRIPITLDSFKPKKGYKEGLFTFGRKLTADEEEYLRKQEELLKNPEQAKIYELNTRKGREQVIIDLYEEVKKRQEESQKLIEQKRKDVEEIIKDVEDLTRKIEESKAPTTTTKKGNIFFKPSVKKMMNAVKDLNKAKDEIEQEIADLEAESEELNATLYYMEDIKDNLSELPVDTKEIIANLNKDVDILNDLIKTNTRQISLVNRLIDDIEKAIKNVTDFIVDLTNEFFKVFPLIPTTTASGFEWKEFYSRYKHPSAVAPKAYLNLNELETIIATLENEQVKPDEKMLQEAKGELVALEDKYKKYQEELAVKQLLLDRFQKIYDEFQTARKEEDNLKKSKKEIEEALKTEDKKNIPTGIVTKGFEEEAKKALNFIWRSTMGRISSKPHHVRANTFGFNLDKLPNRENIRGIYITTKNQHLISAEGTKSLIDYLYDIKERDFNKDDLVALVMVDVSGDKPVLINENGIPLTEDQLKDVGAHAVYQVFPLSKLQWGDEYGGESMFREDVTPEQRKFVEDKYEELRQRIIEFTAQQAEDGEILNEDAHTIGASFGFPVYEQIRNEKDETKNDYSIRTSVEKAGLITKNDFHKRELIQIPKTNDNFTVGTTSFIKALGKPFLKLRDTILPLYNRNHTKKEAETIFDVIKELSRRMIDHEEYKELLDWLSSVVYWGKPANERGYSSIFWEKDSQGRFVLFIPQLNYRVLFTPKSLDENRADIVDNIQKLYININAYMAKDFNTPYDEIIAINPEGRPIIRKWKNYQSYLLSDTYILADVKNSENGTQREGELPLATPMKALKNENDINRHGIYFYTEDNEGDIVIPESKPVAKKEIKAGEITKTPKQEWNFEGGENIMIGAEGRKIYFTATKDGEIKILPKGDIAAVLDIIYEQVSDEWIKQGKINEDKIIVGQEEEIKEEAKRRIKQIVRDRVFGKEQKKQEKILTDEEQLEALNKELEKEVKSVTLPEKLTLNFISSDDLINTSNAEENKIEQNDIRERLKRLSELINCI